MENLPADVQRDKDIARQAIKTINERIEHIDDNRSMRAHWEDIAEAAQALYRRASMIARSDR